MDSPVFILSTGRTGTQFFEDYINQTTNKAICKHEPKPSRRFKFLSNLYLNQKISDRTVIDIYNFSRKSLFKTLDNTIYIESNNFIFGCIPALNQHYPNIKIIHIVRHPVSYIESHLNHGFWKGHKKFFAKHVPYWLEKMDVDTKNEPVKLLGARWKYVNEQIESYKETNDYLMVRFENIFSKDQEKASEKLNMIRTFIGIKRLTTEENSNWLAKPKNSSKEEKNLKSNINNYINNHYQEEIKNLDIIE